MVLAPTSLLLPDRSKVCLLQEISGKFSGSKCFATLGDNPPQVPNVLVLMRTPLSPARRWATLFGRASKQLQTNASILNKRESYSLGALRHANVAINLQIPMIIMKLEGQRERVFQFALPQLLSCQFQPLTLDRSRGVSSSLPLTLTPQEPSEISTSTPGIPYARINSIKASTGYLAVMYS